MSTPFESRRNGGLLAAVIVAAVLASGALTSPSENAGMVAATSQTTLVDEPASALVDYLNAVGESIGAADASATTLPDLLAP